MNANYRAQRMDKMKRRYGYDQWPAEAETRPGGELRGLRVGEDLLPQWRLQRADVVRDEGRPPMTHALWTRGKEEALSVEIWEHASTAAARELLLELLDQFESPLVERLTGPQQVGDLTFGHGEHMLLFSHANVVVRVRNAGRELVPVEGPAREIEASLGRQAPERPSER